ncbi:hypothetical protein [Cellulomonas sp. URHD0024]|uniref:hypothetical protein n=1 Tax=Cellulomonas sp. URHD0024 TaxID=1302620 RepID=UPI0003FC5426|nr:hypothetical protein [Cellulomonas sp. URHD0024]
MSQTTPDPVSGSNDPFRSDDEARDENRPDHDSDRIPFPVIGNLDADADRDEPGDRV